MDELAGPLQLESIEIDLTPANQVTTTTGTLDVRSVEVSDSATGDDWTPVAFDPGSPGWSWLRTDLQRSETYNPPAGRPSRIVIDQTDPVQAFFNQASTVYRASAAPADLLTVRALASPPFLAATGDHVGDSIDGTVMGNPVHFQIVGQTDGVPPLDPSQPFLVVDSPTLAIADYFDSGAATLLVSEWWISVAPGQAAAVSQRLAAAPFGATTIVSREALLATLQGDPVALGVVGALLLGTIAAIILATLAFLVSAAASIESRADEFGLLRALGLTDGQLIRWLAVEQGVLLAVGVIVGIALGIALGWVVLPAVSFTPSGKPPVPPAALVIPWPTLAAIVAGSAGLLMATLVVARRIIGRISVAATLRATVE